MTLAEIQNRPLVLDVGDDDEDYASDSEERQPKAVTKKRTSLKPKSSAAPRRRRRSSARFLTLNNEAIDEDDDEDEDTSASSTPSSQNSQTISELYQKALRMNAENKITASNSWNLSLIDHMDRFLSNEKTTAVVSTQEQEEETVNGVNFTKASCTLDASVKIYSYRVDDVHLTSYKVLANLNRTDGGSKKKSSSTSEDGEDEEAAASSRAKSKATQNVDTLEQNVGKLAVFFSLIPHLSGVFSSVLIYLTFSLLFLYFYCS